MVSVLEIQDTANAGDVNPGSDQDDDAFDTR
jgi:hypothetical protein